MVMFEFIEPEYLRKLVESIESAAQSMRELVSILQNLARVGYDDAGRIRTRAEYIDDGHIRVYDASRSVDFVEILKEFSWFFLNLAESSKLLEGILAKTKIASIASVFNTSVSADTDILTSDLTIPDNGIIRVTCAFDAAGVLRAKITRAGVTKVLDYNAGGSLTANALYIFDLPCKSSDLFNLRYSVNATCHYLEVQFISMPI